MKNVIVLLLASFLIIFKAEAQKNNLVVRVNSPSANVQEVSVEDLPVFFLDGSPIKSEDLKKSFAEDLALIRVFKGRIAQQKFGVSNKSGVVSVLTKTKARSMYWNFLKTQSKEYADLVKDPNHDEHSAYILNGEILMENLEANLSFINSSNFKKMKLVKGELLKKKYNIYDKEYAWVIQTSPFID